MKRAIEHALRLLRGDRGTTAAEFTLIIPALVVMTIGVINLSIVLWGAVTLHYAAEDTARWCMINSTTCTNSTATTYGAGRYTGPLVSPTFTVSTTACAGGEQVTAAATFTLITGVRSFSVPVNAVACRPLG